jgi:microsomal dipeptidase-like Zn-dependent dipeptidase
MKRTSIASTLALLLAGCNESLPSHGPPPCEPIAGYPDSGLPDGSVWGFADLHAHPAVELAFGQRLIWGTALDNAPVNASELPVIASCPVETHDPNASTPIDHMVGSVAFPQVAKIASFAHAPVGDHTFVPGAAWPNGRDVIHQQMNVSSIRRAYEGGLRLMFASVTDNQVLAALLRGPNFINAFVPDPNADYDSARRQFELIEEIIEENENWMGLAHSPDEARQIIRSGRLAIVLSLEMDGVTQLQLDSLVSDYGVQHIIPIHLIDNDVGGTAANSDLFNSASAEVSEIYRSDKQPLGFMDVAPSTWFGRKLGWATTVGPSSPAVYAGFEQVSYPAYAELCYEPLPFCAGPTAVTTPFVGMGQINFRGLCNTHDQCASGARPGGARISHMMNKGLFIDVSHMGYRSVEDTLKIPPNASDGGELQCDGGPYKTGYPLIASHGDIAHLCDSNEADAGCYDYTVPSDPISPSVGGERSLDADQARAIVARHGVLGLGTGVTTYLTRTVFDARGGPLLSLAPSGPSSACAAKPDATGSLPSGCVPVPSIDQAQASASRNVSTLDIQTLGGVSLDPTNPSPHAVPFVRVDLLGPDGRQYQHRVIEQPMQCSTQACSATVTLGTQDAELSPTREPPCNGSVSLAGGGAITSCSSICAQTGGAGCPSTSTPYTVDHIESVGVEWRYLACDLTCQEAAGSLGQDLQCQSTWSGASAPGWTIDEAMVVANTDAGPVTLVDVGPRVSTPITILGQNRGSFGIYQREDRPHVFDYVPATGNLLRITLTSGVEQTLEGASVTGAGANVCAVVRHLVGGVCAPVSLPPAGATECPTGEGWASMNQRGAWGPGTQLFAFARFSGGESSICGADVYVLDWGEQAAPWTIDEVKVEAAEDPLAHFVRRYAAISKNVAANVMGTVAFGTDFNGLNGMMDISECPVPQTALNASSCLVTGDAGAADAGPQRLAPMRLRHADGSLGAPVLIEERGLATYGMLADMMSIIPTIPKCGPDVYASLMLSAEATIRAWEEMRTPGIWAGQSLPTASFDCGDLTGPSAPTCLGDAMPDAGGP